MNSAIFLLWITSFFPLQDPPEVVYDKVRSSVVAIRSMAPLGERSGSGVIIDSSGIILTSYSVVPKGAKNIRVWTTEPGKYINVELIGTSKKDELSLIRIQPKKNIPPILFGKSARIRIGDIAYTVGNAANSIILDTQPSFQIGVISGSYNLQEARANSTYRGIVLETSAAVNVGMEGAPLLDKAGRMIGFITLNYSPNRFLGCAIPIDGQIFVIDRLRKETTSVEKPDPKEAELGITVQSGKGGLVITKILPGCSAEYAGLQVGDIIERIGNDTLRKPEDLDNALKGVQSGDVIWVAVKDIGVIKIHLRGKK